MFLKRRDEGCAKNGLSLTLLVTVKVFAHL
jgi:hypothetical protein